MAADEESELSVPGARPFWSGTISFGLVSIPVALFAANRPRGSTPLKMVSDEGTALRRRYVCSADGKDLEWDDIVRGYEVEKGKFVAVTDEELEAIAPRKSKDIDLRLFVEREELDPKYFDRGYFLTPAGGSTKAYRLLASVMEKTGRAGVATFVMRTKEYVIAILAENGILRAETLRFADEVRTPEQVGLPKVKKAKPAEVQKFARAIQAHAKKIDLSEFLDDSAERLEELARRKQKKKEDVVRVPQEEREEEQGAEVIDLLAVLQKSLRSGETSRKPARRAPAASKKRAAKKK